MADMTLEQVRDLLHHAKATSLTGNFVQLSTEDCAHAYLAIDDALQSRAQGEACCCGDSSHLGTVHRTDGPCFVYTTPPAAAIAT